MSTRSYSGLIVLETVFDNIPAGNPDLDNLALSVFSPFVPVVSEDCGTTLGEPTTVNYDLEGKIELSTGLVISRERIEQLLTHGVYEVAVRSLSTCVAKDGICQKCYHASRQYESTPTVGHSVQILPEYVTGTDVLPTIAGSTTFTLSQTPELYDRVYVYHKGVLFNHSEYSITDNVLTLNSALTDEGQLTVRFTTYIRAPFLTWLAGTYSGSILGIKPLPSPNLIIRKRLLTSLVPDSVLEYLSGQVSSLKGIPEEVVAYIDKVRDPLEKALLVIALYSVYLNVR